MKKENFETWAKTAPGKIRDDLRLAAYAESLGFEIDYDPAKHGPVPHMPLVFSKGPKRIWKAIIKYNKPGWRCADIIDGYSKNHRSYDHLKDALEAEK